MKRRNFLKMMGLLSGSGLASACKPEGSKTFISYLVPPEDAVTPGESSWHPSTCMECPAHCGVLVKMRDGWPIKLEGLPGHPISDGGLCIRGQASITRLYHPERLRQPMAKNEQGQFEPVSWEQAFERIATALDEAGDAGERSRFFSGRTTGALRQLKEQCCRALGIRCEAEFELYGHRALRQSWQLLQGREAVPRYQLESCDFLLSLGTDFLDTGLSPVDYTAQITRLKDRPGSLWWHLGPEASLSSLGAQRTLRLRAGSEQMLLLFVLQQTAPHAKRSLPAELFTTLPAPALAEVAEATGLASAQLEELILRLSKAEAPLLITGGAALEGESGLLLAVLTALIQYSQGALGTSVNLSDGEDFASVAELHEMQDWMNPPGVQEKTGLVLVSQCNLLHDLPEGGEAVRSIETARLRIGMGDVPNETMLQMDLLLPLSHPLECWGETRPRAGTLSLHRPLLPPLFDSRGQGDLLLDLMRIRGKIGVPDSYELMLTDQWMAELGETGRHELLKTGFIALPVAQQSTELQLEALLPLLNQTTPNPPPSGLRLMIVPSLRTFDGRSRPLALLQEIPDPLSTVSYGACVSISPGLARSRSLSDRDLVELRWGSGSIRLAVKIQPGLDDTTLMVTRDALDRLPHRQSESGGLLLGSIPVELRPTGQSSETLAILSGSASQQGRGLIPMEGKLEHELSHSLYPPHSHEPYRWAMVIDLDRCTGCSSCVASCYVENNIPITGQQEHLNGREMSWLRIEPYYDETGNHFLPMLCQHCHNAPCETVCPVNATYHNPDGLNVQVYNRCVGTRYCSNNCPYKVRRFNWFKAQWPSPEDKRLNPDLLVRGRGIMEKCTFCLQRIRAAKEDAKARGRRVNDGEFTTACAQSCPAKAIVFGNLLDPDSEVARLSLDERAFRVFEALGTEPSVYYLRKKAPG